jgi:hypothetical protein
VTVRARAAVCCIDGQIVIKDPDALAVIDAVAKINCRHTLEVHADAVKRFSRRIVERGLSFDDVVIVLLNMNDPNGRVLGDALMPGQDALWEEMRRSGQIPFARGLAEKEGIQSVVSAFDQSMGEKLRGIGGAAAVVVVDHRTIEVFEAAEAEH